MTVTLGQADDFECFDNWLSRWVCRGVLAGETYPQLPIVHDVRSVVDVGANCGAAAVYFARCYPNATVHAVEPAAMPFEVLKRNTSHYPNIRVHNVGLHSSDRVVPLYAGTVDSVTASIVPRPSKNSETHEMITLRRAGDWISEQGISQIDVLKVDAEGAEAEIIEAMSAAMPTVQALYVEYDSADARRRIDRLMDPTHELCQGMMFLDQGEMIYVARDLLVSDPRAEPRLIEFFRRRLIAGGTNPGAR